jgi:hypothetical protein
LSRNNRLFAIASGNNSARLWNLDTNLQVGRPLKFGPSLRLLDANNHYANLSPDGKVLVTACENNAYAWDVHAILKEAGLEDLLAIGANPVSVNTLAAHAR